MRGIVVFLNSNIGTKSESIQPYLYTGMNKLIRLYKSGDNPFENKSLIPFDAKEVCITGEMRETQVFMVESITPCSGQSLPVENPAVNQSSGCTGISEDPSNQNEREAPHEKMY